MLAQLQYDLSKLKERDFPELPEQKRGFRRYFSPILISPVIADKVESKNEDEPQPEPINKFSDQTGGELERLVDLIKLHGFGWKKISALMDNR